MSEHSDPPGLTHGSATAILVAEAGGSTEGVVAAGVECVFDGLLFGQGDNQRRQFEVQTASGVFLTMYDVNAALQKSRRNGTGGNGFYSPKTGIASSDGLQVVLEAESVTKTGCTVLYRTM